MKIQIEFYDTDEQELIGVIEMLLSLLHDKTSQTCSKIIERLGKLVAVTKKNEDAEKKCDNQETVLTKVPRKRTKKVEEFIP